MRLYTYELVSAQDVIGAKKYLKRLLIPNAFVAKYFDLKINERGFVKWEVSLPENYFLKKKFQITDKRAQGIAENYIRKSNQQIKRINKLNFNHIFPVVRKKEIARSNNKVYLTYEVLVKSGLPSLKYSVVRNAQLILVISQFGVVEMSYHFRPIRHRISNHIGTFRNLDFRYNKDKNDVYYEFKPKVSSNRIQGYYRDPLTDSFVSIEESSVILFDNQSYSEFINFPNLKPTLKHLKAEKLPIAKMDRIIFHWTAGLDSISADHEEPYHIVIDKALKVHYFVPINKNEHPIKSGYAKHTGGLNTNSIGITITGNKDAHQNLTGYGGENPITERQWDFMAKVAAELSDVYEIPVSTATILAHGEVQKTLKVTQKGKWDPCVLPWVIDNLLETEGKTEEKIAEDKALAKKYIANQEIDEVEAFRITGNLFRDKVNVYKSRMSRVTNAYSSLNAATILNRKINCYIDDLNVYVKLKDVVEAFTGNDELLIYSRSSSDTRKQNYLVQSLLLEDLEVKDIQVIRFGDQFLIELNHLASKINGKVLNYSFKGEMYQIVNEQSILLNTR